MENQKHSLIQRQRKWIGDWDGEAQREVGFKMKKKGGMLLILQLLAKRLNS